jgi:hypothetical protein
VLVQRLVSFTLMFSLHVHAVDLWESTLTQVAYLKCNRYVSQKFFFGRQCER